VTDLLPQFLFGVVSCPGSLFRVEQAPSLHFFSSFGSSVFSAGTTAFPVDQSFPARFCSSRSSLGVGFRPPAFPTDKCRSSPVLVFPCEGGLGNDFLFYHERSSAAVPESFSSFFVESLSASVYAGFCSTLLPFFDFVPYFSCGLLHVEVGITLESPDQKT
jgi:hypothetical protein